MSLESSVWSIDTPQAMAIRVYTSGSTFYARTCAFDLQSGQRTDVGSAVAGTPGGTSHSAVVSGGVLQIPAGSQTSGAWQTGAQRWSWSLVDLDLEAALSVRWAMLQVQADSFSDNSEARSGESGWGLYLGTAETTAVFGVGVGRPSSGSGTFAASYWATSATAFNLGTASAGRVGGVGFARVHDSSTGCLLSAGLSTSGSLSGNAASGSALSAAPLTHLVLWAGRRGTGTPSAFYSTDPQGLAMFLPGILA